MVLSDGGKLYLTFGGRIIDHLGIQMYHSAAAAIAELVSNSWDAEAETVSISWPSELNEGAEIVIADDGDGLTFDECQQRFLNVGIDRRGGDPAARTAGKDRPVLGRKGIGKFAGFGIAKAIQIETTSGLSGESTVFRLDLDKIRGNAYENGGIEIDVISHSPGEEKDTLKKGTTVRLQQLTLQRLMDAPSFARGLARRFLLTQRYADFRILVNGSPLPNTADPDSVEFVFPDALDEGKRPSGLTVVDGWGVEQVDGKTVRWRVEFFKQPLKESEMRGISVFCKGKIAQTPFLFNIAGGVTGQTGLEYMSGVVEADFLDELAADIIAPERQRINWENEHAIALEKWGQARIKELLTAWKNLRGAKRAKALTDKVSQFSNRLDKFQKHERKTVETALGKLAEIESLSDEQFNTMADAVLVSWEAGRLKDLIHDLAETPDMSEQQLLSILVEANVMAALQTAEAIKTKLEVIRGLEERIRKRELENDIRDYIAQNPWLLSPRWETFRRETSVEKFLATIAGELKLDKDEDWSRRLDLALGSGETLLIVEFMRPGLRVNWDHILRFEEYVLYARTSVNANTAGDWKYVIGYLVADSIDKLPHVVTKIGTLRRDGMYAMDWRELLREAQAQWTDFLNILKERAPEDERVKALAEVAVSVDHQDESRGVAQRG